MRFALPTAAIRSAAEQLFAALYAELHRMAKQQLHRNAFGSTLGATTLLHEAYLDIAGRDPGVSRSGALLCLHSARDARPDH